MSNSNPDRPSRKLLFLSVLLASVLMLAISGCGKKGPPQPPDGAGNFYRIMK